MIRTYKKGKATKLSANFNSTEFDCQGKGCCSETLIDDELVTMLQKIRDHFGKPISVCPAHSGYRCAKHNKEVGGASQSYHTKGMAADISVQGIKHEEVAKYAESIGVKGIGLYDWGCHLDTRTSKSFWKTDKQIPVNTFGGSAPKNINAKVLEFQKAANLDGAKLDEDGIWGPKTEAVAKTMICKKQLIGYKYKNLTKFVQRAVGAEDDGKFGKETRGAVMIWQALCGLVVDGEVGLNSYKRICGV